MIKVNCEACGAPYEVDPRRIPASGLKMRCPKCGSSFMVQPHGSQASSGALDIDLPAPKQTLGGQARPISPAFGGKSASGAAVPKGRESLPDNLADDLLDPPALIGDAGFDLDLDLPAPKGAPAARAPAAKPAGPARLAPAFEEDKPRTFAAAPAASPPSPSFDLDLPAAKPAAGGGFKPSKPGKPAGAPAPEAAPAPLPELDLDLPAPKRPAPNAGASKQALAPEFDLDLPAPAQKSGQGKAPHAPSFDLDLPAASTKGAQAKAPLAPSFDLDLPAASTKGAQAKAPLAPSFDLDLPARKRPGAPAKSAQTAQPALPVPAARVPSELDLPGVKISEPKPASTQKSFAKPQGIDAPPRAAPKLEGGFPKDSLALDPPRFSGQRATGGLGDLDEVQVAFSNKPAQSIDLPAPSDLPAVKRPAGGATMLGLGKLSKDSLDLPRGFEPSTPPPALEMHGLSQPPGPAVEPKPPAHSAAGAGAFGDLDLPAPSDLPRLKGAGAAHAPDPFGDLDLPAPGDLPRAKEGGPGAPLHDAFGDLDLPAPGDLPRAKDAAKPLSASFGDLDLPPASEPSAKKKTMPGGATMLGLGHLAKDALAAGKAGAAKPTPAESAPTPTRGGIGGLLDDSLQSQEDQGGGFELELDLPPAKRPTAANDLSGPIVLEKLSLPPAAPANPTFGATMALGEADLEMTGRGDDPFSGLARRPNNNQTIELDSMLELEGNDARMRPGQGRSAHNSFGELDLGFDDNGPQTGGLPLVQPRPMPVPQAQPAQRAVDAELVGEEAEVGGEARARKKKKARRDGKGVPGYVWPLLVVVLIVATGVGLGMFTHHGYFGVYLVEQLLPAAGDPAQVGAAIAQAEKVAKSDTYPDVRKSLTVLSDARNEAGLNHRLLARSLLNEALYQLRFGEDAQSAQRSVAILARVMERGPDAPGLTLARAADAARAGNLSEAQTLLAQVPRDDDPLHALVAGEIALLQNQPGAAEQAFREAHKLGAGARASWGLARALLAADKLADAEAAAQQTLRESPVHAGALSLMGRQAFARGDTPAALSFARRATGADKVGEQRARPSRRDRAEAWALAGQIEQLREHPREAQAAYEAALAADPLRVDALIGSGTMLMRLGRARDALSRFDSALNARPQTRPDASGKSPQLEAALGAVQALLVLERAQEALPRITALSSSYPEHPDVDLWLGHTLEALDKSDEAEAAFRKTIQHADSSFAGYVALSQLLFKKGRPEEGARVLSEATGKVKDSAEVRRMLGYSELTRNHLAEAVHHFQAALRYDGADAGALLGLTTAQRKLGDLAAAEKSLSKLEKVDPNFAGLTLERGQLLESRGDYAAAAEAYRKALESRPQDTDLKLRLGAALVTAGRLDDAEAILPEVLKERPTSAEAEHFVGRLLFGKGETAQAVQHFERAIAFDALRPEYYLYLGWAYLEQGNLGNALTTINKALERDPNLADARWILGRLQLRTGAVKDAVANFQQTLKLKPGRVEALANMGDAYDQLRDLSGAVRAYQEAVKQAPENGQWWYRLGTLHLDKGSRDEARVALAEAVLRGDRLIEKPSWLAEAHRLYGDVLRDAGRTGEALDQYRVFLELAPASHPDRSEIERIIRSAQR